jgi:hypothetical protein
MLAELMVDLDDERSITMSPLRPTWAVNASGQHRRHPPERSRPIGSSTNRSRSVENTTCSSR